MRLPLVRRQFTLHCVCVCVYVCVCVCCVCVCGHVCMRASVVLSKRNSEELDC